MFSISISDKKFGVSSNGSVIDYYEPDMVSAADYYAFGSLMRSAGDKAYRYGFNGKENDNEVKGGDGLQQDYGMRIYDPRLGRFLSVDPITKDYPELTPYQFASNTPIQAIDIDGLEAWAVNTRTGEKLSGPVDLSKLKESNGWIGGIYDNKGNQIRQPLMLKLPKLSDMPIKEVEILKADMYGVGWMGPKSQVELSISKIRQEYDYAVGENIRGGAFGAIGYLAGGDRGSFVGAAVDGVLLSFAGVSGKKSSVFPKAPVAPNQRFSPSSGSPNLQKTLDLRGTVQLGAFQISKMLIN